ncbi:phage portal protein family protein [Thermus hydrothermalis]|uniref:phage portal protein family protein n=1 Tax=Thermus hydrothermalis TaxID=2908148 RepID=UPI001FAA7076|nr:DUF935 family protein [Thermus hydrothermalis]
MAKVNTYQEPRGWLRAEWTPAEVRTVWAIAQQGDMRPVAELARALLGDDRVAGVMTTRVRALLGLPFSVEPAPGGKRQAALLEERWWDVFPEHIVHDLVVWGLLTGVGLAAISWKEEDGLVWPQLDVWHPGALRWREGAWWVRDAQGQEHPLQEGLWLLYTPYGPKRPWERGLWRALALPWLVKLDAIRYWARDNEVGALRVATAEGPAGATGQELAQLLADLGGDTGLVLPEGWRLEMVAPPDGVWRSKEAAIAWADRAIAVAVLGQNLTTEVQRGSYAAALVHAQVRQDLLEADAEGLATALRQILLRWAEYNFGRPELAPWPRWDPTLPQDRQAEAETLARLANAVATFAQAGVPLDLEALAEQYGIPLRRVEGLRRVRLASGDSPQEAPGFVQGQLYADAVADRLLQRLPDPLEGLEEELARAGSYEEVRDLLMRRFREASPEEVAALTERALVLAGLAGRYSVIRDVER